MAEIMLNLWLDVGIDISAKAGNAHELLGILEDSEFQELVARYKPAEALGATESDEQVLPEGEALEALKEALGASESPEMPGVGEKIAYTDSVTEKDARKLFLQKFGKDK